jgi:alkanesulfonate monooxygenase SsuD/methylene tetrahydromethanopterin reductase-like flavin-dependent oxidoreductase (luciferase family)
MKLGLYMATQWRQGADLGPELANLIEQVRAARASGLASLMVGQHFVSSPLQMFQAMPLLARLAAEAGGMRLGPGLLLLPLLNPVVVAEETATLDWLTDGKAIIGLGLGYRQEEFDSIGVPFKERVPRFAEGVEVIRKLWRDDVVEHQGRFHKLSKVQSSIKPRQPGGPPIWMAGDVEAAVKRAAKLGDAWMPSPMVTQDNVKKLGALFRDTRAALGLPTAAEFPIIRECHVGNGTGKALDEVREPLSFKYEAYASWSVIRASCRRTAFAATSTSSRPAASSSAPRTKWSTRSAATASAPAPTTSCCACNGRGWARRQSCGRSSGSAAWWRRSSSVRSG